MTRKPAPSPFVHRPECPRVDAGFVGIAISAPARVKAPAGMLVNGTVQVPEAEFDASAGVLDAVAMVVTRLPAKGPYSGEGTARFVWMPFRDRVILADDVQRADGLVRGWFTAALPRAVPAFPDRFYLVASVGSHASDVLTIDVG